MLSLAGVSPALHGWLHAAPGCADPCSPEKDGHGESQNGHSNGAPGGHFCGVIALQGAETANTAISLPNLGGVAYSLFRDNGHSLASQAAFDSTQARAPPFRILV